MPLASAGRRHRLPQHRRWSALAATLTLTVLSVGPAAHASTRATGPSLARGVAYLTSPANLIDGHYYQSLPHTADFGLTIDGALALAATGNKNQSLKKIVGFIDAQGADGHGKTVNDWTGIGTKFASGGAIAKEALLAEIVGDSPRSFGGHNLVTALNASVCPHASTSLSGPCPAVGGYTYSDSVFDQALGIIAQLRAGQSASAAKPVAYLESLRNPDGSFPSLIPPGQDHDVDSTAMAVMALALVPGGAARADVSSGLAWIASQQVSDGGFHGVGAISINSTGLAIQALTLDRARYASRIRPALTFLGEEQNADGGFRADSTGQPGSDIRASAQAESGATGKSFGVLTRDLHQVRPASRSSGSGSASLLLWLLVAALWVGAAVIIGRRLLRRRRSGPSAGSGIAADVHDRVGS